MTARAITKRLAKLERKASNRVGSVEPMDFVRRPIDPNGSFWPVVAGQVGGRIWHRREGETEDAFKERVLAEAPREGNRGRRLCMLTELPDDNRAE